MAEKRTDVRGLGAPRKVTGPGLPGDDIEKKRKEQRARTWDKAVKVALAREYESWAHAKRGITRG